MTFWGWILAILLCFALLGFIIQSAEHIFDFDFDKWCRKRSSTPHVKAVKDAAWSIPKPNKEQAKESAKEPDNGSFHIHITGDITLHTQPHK